MLIFKPSPPHKKEYQPKPKHSPQKHVEESAVPITNTVDEEPQEETHYRARAYRRGGPRLRRA